MTDQPPDERSDQPTTDVPVTPDSQTVINPPLPPIAAPNEPSGVGFAALPPPGPQGYIPPPPPPPPGAYGPPPGYPPTPPPGYVQGGPPVPPGYAMGYVPGYAPPPPAPRGGPSAVLVGGLALVLVLVVGVGAMFAFGIGPFARPTASPIARPTSPPTPVVTLAPTAAPTAAPTSGVTAAPTATAGPIASGDVAAQLLAHVPTALAETCFVSPSGSPIVAIASCSADDGAIEVTYFQYDSQESMFQAYEGFRLTSEIEPGSGNCNDPNTWPAEGDFSIGGQPSGRYLCTEALGQTSIYWTDNRLNILSQATHTTADYARLVEFWVSDSGPEL